MNIVGLVRIDLVLQSAGGVSAPELRTAVDLPLSRRRGDGQSGDEVWTPTTSLAGSLRAHAGGQAEHWFGSTPPTAGRAGDAQQLEPSRVRFLGSETTLPSAPAVRSSTAIDPRRGSALTSTLRSREVAPAGTTVSLFLRLDQPPGTNDLEEFAGLVQTWRPVIGRGRSTGHGRARVTRVAWRTLDLRTADGLRAWLTAGRDGLFPTGNGWDKVSTPPVPRAAEAELDLRFTIVSALHLGAGTTTTQDGRTRNAIERDGGKPLLPGTTWKGLLRSRCGYILRSCGHLACLAPAGDSCGVCMLCDLFGWTGDVGEAGTATGRAGRITTHDSVIDGALEAYRDHVGIDRFTGGARRGLLFSDEVVAEGNVSLRVDVTGPAGGARLTPAERGLLLHAVRDLHDGLIGVGHATTRGYGSLRLSAESATVLDELAPSHPTGAAVLALLRGEHS
ncbi:MAG: RAMP superfamily CRISPR-associated protein [Actinomycetota bacterium]|nr:RAMP superfamily CRISPR-associated protein [Actinomycetota bacterium]